MDTALSFIYKFTQIGQFKKYIQTIDITIQNSLPPFVIAELS